MVVTLGKLENWKVEVKAGRDWTLPALVLWSEGVLGLPGGRRYRAV